MDGQRHDEDEEEAEQRPARGPGAGEAIDAASRRGGSSRAGRGASPGAARRRSSSRRRGARRARARRESASSWRLERRSSTPAAFVSGLAVTSWSWPSTAMRPSVPGGRRSRRVVRAQRAAEAVADARAAAVGVEPQLARERGARRAAARPRRGAPRSGQGSRPGSTRNAGSARHSSGSSVREGSIGVGPESSTCRSALVGGEHPDLARRPGLLRRLLRERRSPSGGPRRAPRRSRSSGRRAPARAARPSRRAPAGRPSTATGTVPGRSAPGSVTSRARPGHLELEARLDEERDAVADPCRKTWSAQALAFAAASRRRPQPEEAGLRPAAAGRRPGRRGAGRRGRSPAGTLSDSGRRDQAKRPVRRWRPAAQRAARGAPSRSKTGAGEPSRRTSCGQCSALPGRRTSTARSACEVEAEGAARSAPRSSCRLPGPEADGLPLHRRAAERRHLVEHPGHPRPQAREAGPRARSAGRRRGARRKERPG